MKKLEAIPLILALIGIFAFAGCNKTDPPVFAIASFNGYVIQNNGDDPENPHFGLYLGFSTINGEIINASIIKKDSNLPMTGELYSKGGYDVVPEFHSSLQEIYGTYEARAFSESAVESSASLTINNSVVNGKMGELIVDNFTYDGTVLSARFQKVTNGGSYGFYVNPVQDGVPLSSRLFSSIFLDTETFEDKGYYNVTYYLDLPAFKYNYLIVSPVVIMDGQPLYMFGEERIIRYGENNFEEE